MSQRGRKPDNVSRIIGSGTFPICRLVNKLMVFHKSMCTALEVYERHSKSTVNGSLLWPASAYSSRAVHLCNPCLVDMQQIGSFALAKNNISTDNDKTC